MSEQNKPLEDSPLRCNAAYHMLRFTGKGARLRFALYDQSMALGHNSERFFASLRGAASFFNCYENELYAAAKMLRDSGWWEVIDQGYGQPTNYRPLDHASWVVRHPGRCCEKLPMPWDGQQQDGLGKELFAITGGVTFFPNVLAGWRKLGWCDEEIVLHTRRFVKDNPRPEKRKLSGYRKALGDF